MNQKIDESVNFLHEHGAGKASVGIILGTGLGKLIKDVEIHHEFEYEDLPHFPRSTVEFHKGKLIFGIFGGQNVVIMQGRFHYYEGYSMQEITYPVRVMEKLGITRLLISNAAGAINLNFRKGELMLIDDHINLQGDSPLAFQGNSSLGNIFIDMSEPYDPEMNQQLMHFASEGNIRLHQGIYASVVGPQLETRAEYRMLRNMGADAVGMSTVPEVIAANQLGIKTIAVSVLTDECDPDNLQKVDIAEIIEMANIAEPDLVMLYKKLIESMTD